MDYTNIERECNTLKRVTLLARIAERTGDTKAYRQAVSDMNVAFELLRDLLGYN